MPAVPAGGYSSISFGDYEMRSSRTPDHSRASKAAAARARGNELRAELNSQPSPAKRQGRRPANNRTGRNPTVPEPVVAKAPSGRRGQRSTYSDLTFGSSADTPAISHGRAAVHKGESNTFKSTVPLGPSISKAVAPTPTRVRKAPKCGTPSINFGGDHGSTPIKTRQNPGSKSSVSLAFDPSRRPPSTPLRQTEKGKTAGSGGASVLAFKNGTDGFSPNYKSPGTRRMMKKVETAVSETNVLLKEQPVVRKESSRAPPGGTSNILLSMEPDDQRPLTPRREGKGQGQARKCSETNVVTNWELLSKQPPTPQRNLRMKVDVHNTDQMKATRSRKQFDGPHHKTLSHLQEERFIEPVKTDVSGLDWEAHQKMQAAFLGPGRAHVKHTWQELTKSRTKQFIEKNDFLAGVQRMGLELQPEQAASVFQTFDQNKNGQLTYSEFIRMCHVKKTKVPRVNGFALKDKVLSAKDERAPVSKRTRPAKRGVSPFAVESAPTVQATTNTKAATPAVPPSPTPSIATEAKTRQVTSGAFAGSVETSI